jgi:hypothetical protein
LANPCPEGITTGLHHAQTVISREAAGSSASPKSKTRFSPGKRGFRPQVGDREVHMGTEEGEDRHKTKVHLAYQVTDLAGWRKKLAERGISVLESIPIPGCDPALRQPGGDDRAEG